MKILITCEAHVPEVGIIPLDVTEKLAHFLTGEPPRPENPLYRQDIEIDPMSITWHQIPENCKEYEG